MRTLFGSEKDENWTERYLRGTLSSEELEKFEKQMLTDPALRQEVELQRKTEVLLEGGRMLDVAERLQSPSASRSQG